jgi:hypothetical protein
MNEEKKDRDEDGIGNRIFEVGTAVKLPNQQRQ